MMLSVKQTLYRQW